MLGEDAGDKTGGSCRKGHGDNVWGTWALGSGLGSFHSNQGPWALLSVFVCLFCFALLWMYEGAPPSLPCLVAGGLSKSSSHRFLSRSPSDTFSGFSGSVNSGSSDLTLPSSSSPGGLISHLPLRPQIAEPTPPPVSQGHRHLGAPLHRSPSPPQAPEGAAFCLAIFIPGAFSRRKQRGPCAKARDCLPMENLPSWGKNPGILFWVLAWSLLSFCVPH